MAGPRRFLLYSTAKGSQYTGDFFGHDRLFDVALNDWTGIGAGLEPAEYVFAERGHKWPCIKANLPKLDSQYDYYGFFDYDIEIDTPALNRLFTIGEALNLDLFQAGLGKRSHCCHHTLFARDESLARSATFVEIMMPVFSRDALLKCADTFDESESGYGLDHLWAHILDYRNMAVVDAVVAEHPHPVQSQHWRTSAGLTPMEELRKIQAKYDLRHSSATPAQVLPEGDPAPGQPLPANLAEVVDHYREGRFDAAEAACRSFLQAAPQDSDALNLFGALCGLRGNWHDAFHWILQAFSRQPEHSVYLHNCGFALEQMGREVEALVFYRQSLALAPDYREARTSLERLTQPSGSANSGCE